MAQRLTPYLRRQVLALPLADRLTLLEALRVSVAEPRRDAAAILQHLVATMNEVAGFPVVSDRRDNASAWARAVLCFVARREGLKQSQIGKALQRDHSSIAHAESRIRTAFEYPDQYAEVITLYNRFINAIWKNN